MMLVTSTWPLLLFLISDDVCIDMHNKFARLLAIANMPGISDCDLTSSILNQKSKKYAFYSKKYHFYAMRVNNWDFQIKYFSFFLLICSHKPLVNHDKLVIKSSKTLHFHIVTICETLMIKYHKKHKIQLNSAIFRHVCGIFSKSRRRFLHRIKKHNEWKLK